HGAIVGEQGLQPPLGLDVLGDDAVQLAEEFRALLEVGAAEPAERLDVAADALVQGADRLVARRALDGDPLQRRAEVVHPRQRQQGHADQQEQHRPEAEQQPLREAHSRDESHESTFSLCTCLRSACARSSVDYRSKAVRGILGNGGDRPRKSPPAAHGSVRCAASDRGRAAGVVVAACATLPRPIRDAGGRRRHRRTRSMTISKLLIANRGEIAIRIARAAAESGLSTVAVHSDDDAASLHLRHADATHRLPGRGARAYLDIEAIVEAALRNACDALHPGYGFLSENAELARRCAQAGIRFVGPSVHALALFGDKVQARALAREQGVPLVAGSTGPVDLAQAREFLRGLGAGAAMMIKAVAGGGGRGMRAVFDEAGLEDAFARCRSEARAAFGSDEVYVERLVRAGRHIEVQVVGDASGAAIHLWERECTLQRRHQKLVEIAPSPSLGGKLRERILEAAVRLARAARYDNLGTF